MRAKLLSPELTEAPVAAGRGEAGRRHADEPVLRLPRQRPARAGARRRAVHDPQRRGARKTEPDKNTYLRAARPARRRPGLRLRHALPLPGPRARRAGLPHPDQPRRRRARTGSRCWRDAGPTRHAAADDRRLDLGPVRAAAALHRRERRAAAASGRPRSDFPSTVEDISRRLRARRLRGHPERLATATSGSSRTRRHHGRRPTPHAKQPNSFLYRFVPERQARPDAGGKLQALQVHRRTRTGDADRRSTPATSTPTSQSHGRPRPAHVRQRSSRRSWVTIHDTDVDGTAPVRRQRARRRRRARTPFKRPENGAVPPGHRVHASSSSTRPVTPDATRRGRPDFGGYGGIFKLTPVEPVGGRRARSRCSTRGDADAHRPSTTSRS